MALESDPTSGQPWHGCFLNGVPTITLGHGIENDGVAAHAYYGTTGKLEQPFARLRGKACKACGVFEELYASGLFPNTSCLPLQRFCATSLASTMAPATSKCLPPTPQQPWRLQPRFPSPLCRRRLPWQCPCRPANPSQSGPMFFRLLLVFMKLTPNARVCTFHFRQSSICVRAPLLWIPFPLCFCYFECVRRNVSCRS